MMHLKAHLPAWKTRRTASQITVECKGKKGGILRVARAKSYAIILVILNSTWLPQTDSYEPYWSLNHTPLPRLRFKTCSKESIICDTIRRSKNNTKTDRSRPVWDSRRRHWRSSRGCRWIWLQVSRTISKSGPLHPLLLSSGLERGGGMGHGCHTVQAAATCTEIRKIHLLAAIISLCFGYTHFTHVWSQPILLSVLPLWYVVPGSALMINYEYKYVSMYCSYL